MTSIKLNYVAETKKFGERAEYRERSSFEFTRAGAKKTGKIIDIWLSSAGNQ